MTTSMHIIYADYYIYGFYYVKKKRLSHQDLSEFAYHQGGRITSRPSFSEDQAQKNPHTAGLIEKITHKQAGLGMVFNRRLLSRATIRAVKHAHIMPPGLTPPVRFISYTVEVLYQIEVFGIPARATINPDFAGSAGMEKFTGIRHVPVIRPWKCLRYYLRRASA
jgi:hypothetical protein